MIFYFDANLNLIKNEPESVFQGSNKANTIYFVAPFSSADSVTVKFTLPDGKVTKVGLMTNTATLNGVVDIKSGETYSVWVYAVPQIVTAGAGTVTAQFSVYANEVIYASQSAVFTVNKGVAPVLPETPTEDVYTEILSALTDIKNSKPISEVSNVNIDTDLKESPYIYACSNVTGTLPSFIYSDTSFILEVEVGKNNTDSKYLIQTVMFETLYAYRKKYGDSEWSEWTEIEISTGIDTTGAEKGQVLGFDGEKTVWETPAAAPIKSISGGKTNNVYTPDENGNINIPEVPVDGYFQLGLMKLLGNPPTAGLKYGYTGGGTGLRVQEAYTGEIKSRTSRQPIVPTNLNESVIAALTDAKHIVLTDEQKVTAKSVLGITASEDTPTKLYKHMIVGYLTLNGEQYNFSRWECWSPSNTAFGVDEVFDLLYTQPCFIGNLENSTYVGVILGTAYGHVCCYSQGTNKIDYFTVTKNDITVTSDTVTEL